MIDIGKILKRAWNILWNYKTMWIFAILLALTAGGGGSSGGSNSSYRFSGNNNGFNPDGNNPMWVQDMNEWFDRTAVPVMENPGQYMSTFIWIGVSLLLLFIIIGTIAAFIRYVSESAVIRMVQDYEQTGTKLGFKQGWKLGWTRRAFRMWLIDLIISLPALLFVGLILGLGLLLFSSVHNGNEGAAVAVLVTAIGCTFVFLFAFILFMVFLGLLRHFFVRAAVLEDLPVGQSFRQGWAMFKRNWKSAALVWLIMLGIGIGFGIASFIVFFLLIPAYAVMLLPGAIVAAIPGLIAFGIASLFTTTPFTWIIAGVVALPFLLTVAFLPLTLISGGYMIFESNVWTLTYRELKALESSLPAVEPTETQVEGK